MRKRIFAVLIGSVVLFLLPVCATTSSELAETDSKKPEKEKRAELECNLLLQTVWTKIKENYLTQPVEDKLLFKGALEGIGMALEEEVKVPPTTEPSPLAVWALIEGARKTHPKISEDELCYRAIAEMVTILGDSHSFFMNPKKGKKFLKLLSEKESFVGIGIEFVKNAKTGKIIIKEVLPKGPAERSGLRAGDEILAVDDTNIETLSLEEITPLIRGEAGSKVELTILRKEWSEPQKITVIREIVEIQKVWCEVKQDIPYCKIRDFSIGTAESFSLALLNLVRKTDIKQIIMDLRGNPGGDISELRLVASFNWLGAKVIFIQRNGWGNILIVKGIWEFAPLLYGIPVIVLVNAQSASASEILAGALSYHKSAILIGEKTFGKGTMQTVFLFRDKSILSLTSDEWLMPDGKSVEGAGIEPRIKIELTEENLRNGNDPQLDKAIEIFKSNQYEPILNAPPDNK